MKRFACLLPLIGLTVVTQVALAADLSTSIQAIKSIQKDGKGQTDAIAAVRVLEKASPADLPLLLTAMNDANPIALNWLRSAYETVVDHAGNQLPQQELLAFLNNRENLAQARRLAYDTLKSVDPGIEERLIPTMLDDPSGELRRDAVIYTMKQAEKLAADGKKEEAAEKYRAALSGAVDEDQVKKLAEVLKGYGLKINLVDHYGFLTQWKLIGPFDNLGMKGFDVANPPEKELAFDKEYDGMNGPDGKPLKVTWKELATDDEMGLFDVNKLFAKHKGTTVYLATEFNSGVDQDVEFRLGTSNAWKLWVNGQLLFAREEYHRGMAIDQYQVRGHLKSGKNTILLKLLENEQTQDWAQDYSVQFRVSDFSGRAIHQSKPVAAK
ncbi:MAG: hypothetical protein U0929_06750 [Planctomycetaceae bacterium]